MMVRFHHVFLVNANDLLSVVLDLGKQRQELREIHFTPSLQVGIAPEGFRQQLVPLFRTLDSLGQFPFPGKRNVVQFFLKAFLEAWNVAIEQVAPSLLFTGQGERKTGVHSFRAFFHLLAGEYALIVFPQNHIDRATQLIEQPDGVQTDPKKENENREKPEKDSLLHGAARAEFSKSIHLSLRKLGSPPRRVFGLRAPLKNLLTISTRSILMFN